jgi:hypothetical protein
VRRRTSSPLSGGPSPGGRQADAGSNRALSDRRYTIIFRVVKLADAVDVDACAVVLQFVVDVYNYRITPIGFNDGTWQLSVDGKSDAL